MDLLFAAIVDGGGDFGLQSIALYDAVDVTVFEKKFARLKSFWELDANRCFDGPWSCKSNQGLGLSKYQIAQTRETSCDTTHGWVGEYTDV